MTINSVKYKILACNPGPKCDIMGPAGNNWTINLLKITALNFLGKRPTPCSKRSLN